MSRVKNPQEKKRLSLEHDRRPNYGNNDKAARKAVPRRKAGVNRANRRADTVALSDVIGAPDEVVEAGAEDAVLGRRRKVWRKFPDLRLRTKVAEKLGDDEYVDPEVRSARSTRAVIGSAWRVSAWSTDRALFFICAARRGTGRQAARPRRPRSRPKAALSQ